MYSIATDVTAISFDIWKTLLNGNKAFTRPRLQLIWNLLGLPVVDIERLREAYLEADKLFNELAEVDKRDYGMAPRLSFMYMILGINAKLPSAETISEIQVQVGQLRSQPEYLPTFIEPDIRQTLERLYAQGYALGLLSNTGIDDRDVMEPVLKALGLWDIFDVTVFTSEDGRAKPNPDLFRDTAKLLHAEPHQVLHVGDNPVADYYGATGADLHAVVYDPKDATGLPHITTMKELTGR